MKMKAEAKVELPHAKEYQNWPTQQALEANKRPTQLGLVLKGYCCLVPL